MELNRKEKGEPDNTVESSTSSVEDLKQKRHKVDVHKEAVRLYMHEMEKPEGARMSSRNTIT